MPHTWTIAQGPIGPRTGKGSEVCGHCGRHVENGKPILLITLAGVSRRRVRCEDCAARFGYGPVNDAEVDAAIHAIEAREASAASPTSRPPAPPRPPGMTPLFEAAGSIFNQPRRGTE